jgi:hypothetical protein
VHASEIFYTVTAEIALSRHEGRVAALEYTAATESNRDPRLLRRAAEVTANCLQPSLTDLVATRWIAAESQSVDAHRAAAHALLDLDHVAASAAEYRAVVNISAKGAAAELAALETEFAADDNVYGARRVADQLAKAFPTSSAARRLQAFAALRADDPASAVTAFEAALAATPQPEASERGFLRVTIRLRLRRRRPRRRRRARRRVASPMRYCYWRRRMMQGRRHSLRC